MPHPTIFSSFFMGGFEACYAHSEHGHRHDMLRSTLHDVHCREDYQALKALGITTVRESLSWHQIDRGNGRYDFAFFENIMRIAQEEGMQVIWGLNHFDLPDNLDPFAPETVDRFVAYALAALTTIRRYDPGQLFLIPFNEISFFSWMGGEVGVWGPHVRDQGLELKIQLVRCVIGAIRAVRQVDTNVCFIHIDPILNRMTTEQEPDIQRFVNDFREGMYEAWDMISGRCRPELGGQPDYLDFVGLNYYYNNQEVVTTRYEPDSDRPYFHTELLDWDSPLRVGLDQLMRATYERYQVPLIITETGSYGSLREAWWERLLQEVNQAIAAGIPVLGICSYPIIDRPDWHYGHLTNSGFWDFEPDDPACRRIPQEQVLRIIRAYLQS